MIIYLPDDSRIDAAIQDFLDNFQDRAGFFLLFLDTEVKQANTDNIDVAEMTMPEGYYAEEVDSEADYEASVREVAWEVLLKLSKEVLKRDKQKTRRA